jgi:hypothetical protein
VNIVEPPFPSYAVQQGLIDAAWDLCERQWATLEPPLSDLVTRFLCTVAGTSGTHRGYFSNPLAPPLLYLPIWLFDSLVQRQTLDPELRPALIQILAGTMQGYLYVRTQDDVLDEPARADCDLLLLGNVCCSGMTRAYGEVLGPRAALFWREYDRAMVDFSNMTLAEHHAVLSDTPYETKLFEQHADKVAFARIPMLAVATLASRLDLAPLVATLVHQLGIAYGLVNDVIGWPRDLRAGQRTYLLARAGLQRADLMAPNAAKDDVEQLAHTEALTEKLREKLYEGRLLHDTIGEAIAVHNQALETAKALELHGFEAFHTDRTAWLSKLDSQISTLTLTRIIRRGRAT